MDKKTNDCFGEGIYLLTCRHLKTNCKVSGNQIHWQIFLYFCGTCTITGDPPLNIQPYVNLKPCLSTLCAGLPLLLPLLYPSPPPSLHWLLLTPVCPDNTVMLKQSGSAEKTSTQEGSTQTAASSFRVSKDILYPGCRKTTPRNLSQTGQSQQPSSSPTLWSRHRSGAPTWGI